MTSLLKSVTKIVLLALMDFVVLVFSVLTVSKDRNMCLNDFVEYANVFKHSCAYMLHRFNYIYIDIYFNKLTK